MVVLELSYHAENYSKMCSRYTKALKEAGVSKGSIVCMMMGRNNTNVFYAGFGAWSLGGVLLFGDVRAGTKALASQVTVALVPSLNDWPGLFKLVSYSSNIICVGSCYNCHDKIIPAATNGVYPLDTLVSKSAQRLHKCLYTRL